MPLKTRPLIAALLTAGLFTLTSLPAASAVEKGVATDLEPLHHVILENQYVTVMRVIIRPGQSTQYHEQHLDYVNTHVNGSRVSISWPDKLAKESEMKSGNVKFGAHQGKSTVDRVTNIDTTINHQVAFEIKQHGPLGFGDATRPDSPLFQQVLSQKTVKGWKLTLQPGEGTGAYAQHGPGVRVFFTEGRLLVAVPGQPNRNKEIWIHRGDAMLTDPGKVELTNGGETPLIFNDYELL